MASIMPRLSVDIDLTYLPVKPREESLTEIDAVRRKLWRGDLYAGKLLQRSIVSIRAIYSVSATCWEIRYQR
ncbi:hypothetical protein KIP88_43455 [Bradyrhizobium sp. SRL28]|nr:hypothetical protein [Bradyrhizobium sp. SRL28]MBT1517199.1 hypothetical protein [Bradyrhizobium sp. SRL28]